MAPGPVIREEICGVLSTSLSPPSRSASVYRVNPPALTPPSIRSLSFLTGASEASELLNDRVEQEHRHRVFDHGWGHNFWVFWSGTVGLHSTECFSARVCSVWGTGLFLTGRRGSAPHRIVSTVSSARLEVSTS